MPSSLRILASVPAEKIWGLTFNVKAVNVAWQQNPNHLWNHHHNNLKYQFCQRITKLWKRLWFQDVMVLMLICDENFNIASLFCLLSPSNHFSWKPNWGQKTTSLPHSPENPKVSCIFISFCIVGIQTNYNAGSNLSYCDFIFITLVFFATNANIKMNKRWVWQSTTTNDTATDQGFFYS